ncbi:MAG: nickel-dependent lactate racemase, partial [Thermodesulfobacteriota bacterium]
LEIEKALDNPIKQAPLEDWVKANDTILLVSDDNTRLTPADRIIPALLNRLNQAGVPDSNISCIMALGTHRYMTQDEMISKVGDGVYNRIKVINHNWQDQGALVDLGVSKQGTPLQVNRAVVEADVVIGLGAIVPHHIPGFSGSSKIIQPGISGVKTTAETHMLSCESGGDSFLGIEDNPVRRDMDDMADRVGMKTIFNVVLNSDGGVVGIFFGDMRAAYKQGVKLAKKIYGVIYTEEPDIVLVNSHPCNLDFWQSHKSLYPAQRMVKKGGSIIVCTPAPEGVSPVHTDLLAFTSWSSSEIKAAYRSGELKNGVACALAVAWAMVREHAEIITVSDGLSHEDKIKLGHKHAPDIAAALNLGFELQGTGARVSVLTHAPDMLPIRK